jgi:hypothetical protein
MIDPPDDVRDALRHGVNSHGVAGVRQGGQPAVPAGVAAVFLEEGAAGKFVSIPR